MPFEYNWLYPKCISDLGCMLHTVLSKPQNNPRNRGQWLPITFRQGQQGEIASLKHKTNVPQFTQKDPDTGGILSKPFAISKSGKRERQKTTMGSFHEKIAGWWLRPDEAGELGNVVFQTSSIMMWGSCLL